MPSMTSLEKLSRTRTGRVLVLEGPRRCVLRDHPIPAPKAGEVRIRVEGCGVCGSNVPLWEGREWFTYPTEPGAPGHEAWGRIDALGSEVEGLSEGQRVAALSYHGFADYDVAPAWHVVQIPEELGDMPFPGEPLGCAINVFWRAQINSGQTVAVVGVGFLGALLIQLLHAAGAEVIAISRRPFALQIARQCGAHHVLRMGSASEVIDAVNDLTRGRGCPCVIEASGLQEPLQIAGELVKVRGRLVIAGYHQDGMRSIDLQSWNWRGIDVINAHEREANVYIAGMREAVAAVQAGRLRPEPLLTHTFALEEFSAALDCAARRPEGFLKAVVLNAAPRRRSLL